MSSRCTWGLVLLVAMLGCSRDFGLPESDFAIQSVTVEPAIVREGESLTLTVRTLGPTPTSIEQTRLLPRSTCRRQRPRCWCGAGSRRIYCLAQRIWGWG